jgi:DNA-binding beta-propeller fold protein YncE
MYKQNAAAISWTFLVTLGFVAQHAHALGKPAVPIEAKKADAQSMRLHSHTDLPGYTGDFDHFAVDTKGNRLFLAAEDHGTLEVFDLASGRRLKTIEGVEVPHGILYLAKKNRLIVTDSGAGFSKVLDASTYKVIDTIKLISGADSMAYDAGDKHMYIVTGGKNGNMENSYLSKIDPATGKNLGELKFETDKVEAMAIEQKGPNLYINVAGKNYVAVVDKKTFSVVGTWPIKEAEMNAPMAFDEANHRLFVVTRKPYKLLILDTATGSTIASFAAPERTNEAIYDKLNRRIYLAGDDFIGVYRQNDADHYEELSHIPTAKGAKTAILVPELSRLYVAVSPGEGKTGAAVLRFDVAPAK